MKKLIIGFVILLVLAQLGDKFLCNDSDTESSKNVKEQPTSTNDKPYYDCDIHKKFFHNGKCTSCELQEDINKKDGFLDKTKSY